MSVILVAEQDASYAERIAATLRASGWSAQAVTDPQSARQIAASTTPILLIASATLASVETLLASFSQSRGGPGSVVLVPNAVAAQVSASDYQADEMLAKPFSEEELRQVVRQTIERGRRVAEEPRRTRPKQQLTSVDIFGDLLAEVEEEAQRAEISRRQTQNARAATPAPPAAPSTEAPAGREETSPPKPRRTSTDDIDRKLEETLSGVMPERLRRAASPSKEEAVPTPGAEKPRARSRSELPSDNEIDDLLDRTLSSLELPARPRKPKPVPEPVADSPATPPTPEPPPTLEPPPTPVVPGETVAIDRASDPLDDMPVVPPLTFDAPEPPAESPPEALSSAGSAEAPTFEAPASEAPAFEPPTLEPPQLELSPFEPPEVESSTVESAPLEPAPFEPSEAAPSPFASSPPIPESSPSAVAEQAPASEATGDVLDFDSAALGDPPLGLSDAVGPEPKEEPPPPAAVAADQGPGLGEAPAAPEDSSAWGFDTSMDLFPSSFGEPPSTTEQTAPTSGDEDSFAAVFEAPGATPIAPPSSPAGPEPAPSVAQESRQDSDAVELAESSSVFDADLPAPPTSFADAWAPSPPASSFATSPMESPASLSAGMPAANGSPLEASSAEPTTDHGAEAALESVLELRGDDLATRRLPVVEAGSGEDGQRFGDYALLERVAVGGMAEVWRARRRGVEGFQKIVAIKRILSHLTDTSDFIDMFVDEAKLAAQLSHANITQIYDLGKADGDFFIAMEYVEGKDLRTLGKHLAEQGRTLPLGLGLMVVAAVARALDYAHRKRDFDNRDLGLVHRDVSPQNVLISYEGEIKLCDFGIVKAVAKASTTQMGALKGKLQYMSPEQAWGKTVDSRSDIFSLGSVLFEVVTGEKLFIGDSEIGVLDAVRECRIRNPRDLVPDLPESVEQIIHKALAKTPEERYQTAGEMEHDLQAVLRQLDHAPTQKDLASFMESLYHPPQQFHSYDPKPESDDGEAKSPRAAVRDGGKTPSRDKGRTAALVAVVLLLLLALAAWFFLSGRGNGSPAPATSPEGATIPASTPRPPGAEPGIAGAPQGDRPTTEAGGELPTEEATDDATDPGGPAPGRPDPGGPDPGGPDPDQLAADGEESEAGQGGASGAPTIPGGNVDIEALVAKEMEAREQKLRSEYEAQRRALEAELARTQTEISPPEGENGDENGGENTGRNNEENNNEEGGGSGGNGDESP